jgi:hypothetical protein
MAKVFKNRVYVDGNWYDPGDECPSEIEDQVDEANFEGDDFEEDGEDGYTAMGVDELKDLLRDRGLPVSGTKPELIQRLESDDNASD